MSAYTSCNLVFYAVRVLSKGGSTFRDVMPCNQAECLPDYGASYPIWGEVRMSPFGTPAIIFNMAQAMADNDDEYASNR